MKKLLITGTDTNVGKTWVACQLLNQLRTEGVNAGVYKPVCSGAEGDAESGLYWQDLKQLRAAVNDAFEIERICPQRFCAPVAPNVAARLENRSVDDRLLRSGADDWRDCCDYLVIEGAGGLLCPLTDHTTVADLAADLQAPILIVAANRLGVINHTMLTVAVAQQRNLAIAGVVLNELPGGPIHDQLARDTNFRELEQWIPEIPIYSCAPQQHQVQAVPSLFESEPLSKLFS